jgi:hypothetical protein
MSRPKDWITAGGILGLAILTARATKTPLANILAAMPFLLKHLREAENTQSAGGGGSAAMTREEACLILGVGSNADRQQIAEAHRRLIQKNHPDLGGTDYLAAKINQARDILLRT